MPAKSVNLWVFGQTNQPRSWTMATYGWFWVDDDYLYM
jgi:hypothetical protein